MTMILYRYHCHPVVVPLDPKSILLDIPHTSQVPPISISTIPYASYIVGPTFIPNQSEIDPGGIWDDPRMILKKSKTDI